MLTSIRRLPAFTPVYTQIWRQMGIITMAAAALGGCVTSGPQRLGAHRIDAGVAVDEPRAALVGRDMLAAGGNAVDAAVAMGLAMSVALPSRAGLGGGGVCVVHDPLGNRVRTIDFLPRSADGKADGATAVPAMLRGLYALHAAHGKLHWEQTVVPAETLARLKPGSSRAMVRDIQVFGHAMMEDPEARRVLLLDNGETPPAEGQDIPQTDLAGVLGQVRQRGVGAFYMGPLADTVAAGLKLDAGALRTYQPQWRETEALNYGNGVMHFAGLPEGDAAADVWRSVLAAPAGERNRHLLDALAPVDPRAPPTAGLVAFDATGQGVACAFSMGGGFGTGRMAPGTGILQAAATGPSGIGGPVLMVNPNLNLTLFAAAGSLIGVGIGEEGGAAAPAAVTSVALRALEQGLSAREAIAAPRLAPDPAGGVLIEQSVDPASARDLGQVYQVQGLGRVNLVDCKVNRSDGQKNCTAATDTRGFGLALSVE
jgi:gamma-glutamyltranspeptidase/glutathione hydrolase